jgi:hypothetical protein
MVTTRSRRIDSFLLYSFTLAAGAKTSLQKAIVYFADPDNCREYVAALA